MIKVLISYDMRDGQEQECQEFVINKVAPALAKLGFNVSDVWFTVWGKSPQILSGGEVDDMTEVRRIFLSTEWGELTEKLESLTENLRVRIVPAKDE